MRTPRWLQPLLVPGAIIMIWQAAVSVRLIDPLLFPPPATLVATAAGMLRSGDLEQHVAATLWRTVTGAGVGIVAGILCGIAMGAWPNIHRLLEPVVSSLNSLPKLTLLPMLMILVGTGDRARVLVVAAGAFVVVALHTLDGVRSVGRHYVEMAVNCGASRWLQLRSVYLPGSAPQVFTGVRLAMGRSLVLTLSIEMISSREGLGSVVWQSWESFATDRLYVAVITATILGTAIHQGLRLMEARLIPWKHH